MAKQITAITRQLCGEFKTELMEPLQDFFNTYYPGVRVEITGGTFSPADVTYRLTLAVEGKKQEQDAKYAKMFGYAEIGTKFTCNGETFEVDSYAPSRPKFPIIAKRVPDGKRFKFTPEAVNRGIIKPRVPVKKTGAKKS
jgi:hypothetical protein